MSSLMEFKWTVYFLNINYHHRSETLGVPFNVRQESRQDHYLIKSNMGLASFRILASRYFIEPHSFSWTRVTQSYCYACRKGPSFNCPKARLAEPAWALLASSATSRLPPGLEGRWAACWQGLSATRSCLPLSCAIPQDSPTWTGPFSRRVPSASHWVSAEAATVWRRSLGVHLWAHRYARLGWHSAERTSIAYIPCVVKLDSFSAPTSRRPHASSGRKV